MPTKLIDDSAVFKTLDNLERHLTSSQHKSAVVKATRKGGNVLKQAIKNEIPNEGGFEHISFIKRNIKVLAAKSWRKYPGVNVLIKGADVPVGQGATRRFWKLASYAYLVFFGSDGKRTTRTGGKNRGEVNGIVNQNPFEKARQTYGRAAMQVSKIHLFEELKKVIAKSVVKNA